MSAKHTWTEEELWVVCVCYREGIPVDVALSLTNTTNRKSMEMRYRNCLFLDKGQVGDALSHASKLHQKVWKEVDDMYKNKEVVIVEPDCFKIADSIIIFLIVLYLTIFTLS